jgi:hypothetical protein
MPPSNSPNLPLDDFEQSLRQVEDSLLQLKARYHHIQSHQAEQQSLLEQQQRLRDRLRAEPSLELKQQLQAIEDQLQELKIALESELLSDRQTKQLMGELLRNGIIGEAFWQIIRFGGLGVVLGWLLKSWAG